MAETKRCEGPECGVEFEPARSTAKYHSATCRQRAARDRKAAASSVESDVEDGKAEHPLVRSVRLELDQAKKAETFNGQLALQLARRLTNPEESGVTALSKELRSVMGIALADGSAPAPVEGDGEEEDEVTTARRQREKARQKAGLS